MANVLVGTFHKLQVEATTCAGASLAHGSDPQTTASQARDIANKTHTTLGAGVAVVAFEPPMGLRDHVSHKLRTQAQKSTMCADSPMDRQAARSSVPLPPSEDGADRLPSVAQAQPSLWDQVYQGA